MNVRIRLAVLVGAVVFGTGMLGMSGVAVADDDPPPWVPPWAQLCAGFVPTIFVVPGVPNTGTSGNDVILGTPFADEINAGDGNDIVCGLGLDDLIEGGAGADLLLGQGGNDQLDGDGGDDHLFGGEGDDNMLGGDGADVLNGGGHVMGDSGNGQLGADSCPLTEFPTSC